MAKPGYDDFTACPTPRRRRLPDRVHLGHHRRAEGHDALPPRHAGDLRHLRQICAASRADRRVHRLAAARLHLRARRPRAVPAARRRLDRAAGEGAARRAAARRSRATSATVCFTAPTAYRAMLAQAQPSTTSRRLRNCVSAGETLPKATFEAWHEATGIEILDGIGATEMLHIFIGSPERRRSRRRDRQAGAGLRGADRRRGRPRGAARHRRARLRCAGPTGCRYLADPRQTKYVAERLELHRRHLPCMDEDGYFWYQARSDDMIISAGYNIAGPEVEDALLGHPAVAECARGRRARRGARPRS